MVETWKQRAQQLKQELHALYLASKDRRVPWHVRALAVCIVAYAFSPIDLIPDPIPILGYLDDLVLIPLGVALMLKMMPAPVMEEHRQAARAETGSTKPQNWLAGGAIIAVWILLVLLVIRLLLALGR